MKKIILMVAAATMFISCGTTKQVQQYAPQNYSSTSKNQVANGGLGAEVAKSPAQIYAEDPNATTLRAYASYNALPSMNVIALATNQARGELALSIAALVKAANTTYMEQYSKEQLSGQQIEQIMLANSSANQKIEQVAAELVRFAPVKVSNEYMQPNGTKTAHVAVELHPQNILKAIQENTEYQEAVNSKMQAEIDYKSEQYGQSLTQSFEELKQAKAEGK